MAFCTKCGNQLDGDTKFCTRCGQAVEGTAASAPAPVSVPPVAVAPPQPMQGAPVQPRVKKPKGMVSKIVGIVLMAAVVFLLDYFGMPGYIAAIMLAALGACSLLRNNQNGKAWEKFALLGAALLAVVTYCLTTGPRFGAYFAMLVFVGTGLGFTRLYKQKPGIKAWLFETVPVVLYFCLFERLGGAISKVPGIISGISVDVIARYGEAFFLLIAFVVIQLLHNKQPAAYARDSVLPKRKGLRMWGRILFAAAVLLIWFNPFGVLVFDNIKGRVWDALSGYGEGKSVVTTLSNSNGTSLLMVNGAGSVTSETAALELLMQYDKELSGEYSFVDSVALPSGNILYRFAQVNKGIAVEGGAKNLVVDANGQPLYLVGQTKIISWDLTVPKDTLSETQAKNTLQEQFDDLGATIGAPEKVWYFAETEDQSAYSLAYTATITFVDEAEEVSTCSVILDAVSSEILDISFEDDGLATVLQNAKLNGSFEDADFEAIIKAAQQILSGTQINAWRYRDVLEQECLSFYDDRLGKSNANALVKAFESAGVKGANVDEGTVGVDLKNSRVKLKGTTNFAYDTDDMLLTQNSGRTQRYTITTAVPITLVIQNTKGEHILTLPVFDMETFELYPSSRDEQFVFTVQGGSRFQSTAKTSYAPALPGMIMAQAAEDDFAQWASAVDASYELTIEQFSTTNDSNVQTVDGLLGKIEDAYNYESGRSKGNGARYLSLYRFDQLSETAQEAFEPMSEFGASGAALEKMYKSFSSTRWMSTVAQMLLVSYRAGNEMFAPMMKGVMAQAAQASGGYTLATDEEIDKMVSDAPDRTAILATLFMLNGRFDYFESLYNTTDKEKFGLLTNLDNTKMSLKKISQTGDEVTVRVTITGATNFEETITVLVQEFGEATGSSPEDLGPDAAWFTSLIADMKSTFTSGIYLGFDMERMFDMMGEGANNAPGGDAGDGEDEKEPGTVKHTTPKNTVTTALLASFADAAYDESLYATYDRIGKPVRVGGGIEEGWTITYANHDGDWSLGTDYYYLIFEKGDDVVIAFRGTPAFTIPSIAWAIPILRSDPILTPAPILVAYLSKLVYDNRTVLGNWIETAGLILEGKHPQDFLVKKDVSEGAIKNCLKPGKKIYITGHSLGGHLALIAYSSIQGIGYDSLVKRVETFNAVGIKKQDAAAIEIYGSQKVIHHNTCCDIATGVSLGKALAYPGEMRGINIGTMQKLEQKQDHKKHDGIDAHSMKWFSSMGVYSLEPEATPQPGPAPQPTPRS